MANLLICDECGETLTVETSYPAKYSLQLDCINTGYNTSGVTYAVHIDPPFNGIKHFCGFGCLSKFIERTTKPSGWEGNSASEVKIEFS